MAEFDHEVFRRQLQTAQQALEHLAPVVGRYMAFARRGRADEVRGSAVGVRAAAGITGQSGPGEGSVSARTFVVAEVAATHGGSLDAALRLVGLAREVGADAVKFQWLSDPERLVERRRAPVYLEQYRRLVFPREWFPTLKERAGAAGVEFMCTAYLPEDVH